MLSLDVVFGCPGGQRGSGGGGGGSGNCPMGAASCDLSHLCPTDPMKGAGLCDTGCCVYGKL